MSDDEDVVSGSEEEEEDEPTPPKKMAASSGPSEAELAMQRRREQLGNIAGVDEQTMELLELARQEREREAEEIRILRERRKRRKGNISTADLDEAAQELLEENRKERARMEEEIQELRQRSEQRKKERIEQEKEMAVRRAEDEARRKAEEEERKSKKEAEDNKRKAARDAKMAEFESKKNPQKPNFVISKKTDLSAPMVPLQDAEDEERADKKSKEQMEAEKRAILAQRIQPLEISGFDTAKLTEKAKELNGLIHRLESEKYDLEKRFKDQQYDMMELAERARQMNQVGRGGLKRINLGPDESDPIQEKFAGAPAKVEMYSKFERQQDKRKYCERHQVFKGETWIAPPKRISPHRVLKWDENTGLPSYQFLPGMEPKEEEGEQEE